MGTFIGQLIGFVVIILVLRKYAVPPIKKAMANQKAAIAKQLDDAEKAKARLKESEAAHQKAVADADQESAQIRENARGDADSIREDVAAQSKRDVARIKEHGAGQAALSRSNIVRGLSGALGLSAVGVTGLVVREYLQTPEAQAESIDRTIGELEVMAAPGKPNVSSPTERFGTHSLGAASREAVRTLTDTFDSIAAGLDEQGLASLADELASVVGLLGREHVLRKHLAEHNDDTESKRALVHRIFSGQLSENALTITADAAASHWSAVADFPNTLERLFRLALLSSAEKAGRLDDTEDELFRFARLLDREPELTKLLSDTTAPLDGRLSLLNSVVNGRVNSTTEQLLQHTVRVIRHRRVDAAVAAIADLAAARRGESVAHLTSASPLTPQQVDRVSKALTQLYGKPMSVQTEVDASLLGGLRVTVGDEKIEGDIATRLANAEASVPR